MVAGDTGTAMVLAMAFPETGAMPFRSTDADHTVIKTVTKTDINMDTDTTLDMTPDMTLDMGIPVTQGGTQATTRILRIRAITILLIRHGHTRRSAMAYSNRMAGKLPGLPQRKLWPDEP